MLENLYKTSKDKMQKTTDLLSLELSKIRTARANPAILDEVKVNYYGSVTPLKQVASISAPEPRMLVVQPWDRNAMSEIEKALQKAELGLNPIVEGNLIRLPIPALTEERRKELVKLCHKLAEDTKIAVRNIRREGNEAIKKLQKDKKISEDDSEKGNKKIQEFTDEFIKNIDVLFGKKEKEILEK
ncbi:MAG: ribosome recycling factor [Candidatus Latescibacteria bacterium]|nr:ribosome recycling factor [Candidatus Latescibacterota bacterium]